MDILAYPWKPFVWLFLFLVDFHLPVTELLYGIVDDLISCCWLGWCHVCHFTYDCLLICFVFFFVLAWIEIDWFINRLIDWLIDPSMIGWLIVRPIDRSIDWLIGCWLTGYSGSFLRSRLLVLFYSVPCAHERCDPCEFLLALRGFVELISVMVRFRTRCYFDPPGGDSRTPHLEP